MGKIAIHVKYEMILRDLHLAPVILASRQNKTKIRHGLKSCLMIYATPTTFTHIYTMVNLQAMLIIN